MKNFLLLLLAFLVANFPNLLLGQGIGCPDVISSPDTTVCGTPCLQLNATPVAGFQTTSYTVQQIPYNPYSFTTGNQVIVNTDDIWSAVLPIGFNFCFYGNTYNQCVVGSNGLISFDISQAGNVCQYQVPAAIPSNQIPMNSIMAPFHDIDPRFGGAIRWDTLGSAPCRTFVVSFFQIPLFSCNNLIASQQIVLYEATNIIETYIANKPTCTTWQSGAAIHGIQNATGTAATVVPGRNLPTQWAVTNDAWAFYPAGAQSYTLSWYEVGNPTVIATTDTVTVCPTGSSDYAVVAQYVGCAGDTVIVSDTTSIFVAGSPFQVSVSGTNVSCFGANDGTAAANTSGATGPFSYLWIPGNMTTQTVTGLAPGTYTVVVTDTGACAVSATITITEPPAIALTTTQTNVSCFGQATGSASVQATGGTPGYTYAWSPSGGTAATASNLAAGTYSVIVTDSAGCMDTATVTITQPPQITTTTSSVPVSCFGGMDGSAVASSAGGTGFLVHTWSPGILVGDSATGLAAGTYTVTATDSFGCTNSVQVVITQPSSISLSATVQDVSCNGGADGSATVSASGGTPGYNYQWTPSGGTNALAIGLSAGTYQCLVTDANGCQDSILVVVGEPNLLVMTMSSVDETCVGTCDGAVAATPAGGTPPYTFSWNATGNPTTASVQNLCSGTYAVTVTDANNCTAVDSVVVSAPAPPIANAGPDVDFCEGEGGAMLTGSATGGGGAPYYYTWSCATPLCGLSCINCPNPIANPTDTTVYYLVVTDMNGCTSAPDSVVVNVKPKPQVNAGPDVAICGQPAPCTVLMPNVTIGSGVYSYNWTPGVGLNDSTILNPCARPDTTTIYALIVTDLVTGCTSDFTTTDTVSTVLVEVSPTPVADAGPDLVICEGSSEVLQGIATGAGPAYTYQWSPTTGLSNPNIANPVASPALTTVYSLVVFSNGCPSIADSVTVYVTEIPTVDAGQNRDICAGDSAFLDGSATVSNQVIPDSIVSYRWFPTNGLSDSTQPDVMASPAQTQWYYLEVMTTQGCSNLDSVLVTINPSPIVDAGENIVICDGTGPFDLLGTIDWVNNNPPGDLQNILIEWQPVQFIIGQNDQQAVQVDPDQSMYFYFTVTFNTCSHTDSVLVSVIEEVIATADADTNATCEGDSVLLTATGGIGGASFQWMPTTGLANPNSAVTMAAPDTTTTYMVVVTEAGCSDTAEITINVIPGPEISYANSLAEGCVPLEVSFTALASDAIFYTWNFGDGSPVSNEEQPFHTYDSVGNYTVTLFGTNIGGCVSQTSEVTVMVHDSISGDFTSDPSHPIELTLPNTTVNFFDETENSVAWSWDFGNGQSASVPNPVYQFTEPGTYTVSMTVTNAYGCVSTIQHGPYVINVPELFIPNVFSPNGDGVNDNFRVEYSGSQPFLLRVFDRWGVEVYQTRNKQALWDGSSEQGALPEGVYYYTLRVGDREFSGNITMIR